MVNWYGKNIHVELKFLHSSCSSSISGSSVSTSLVFSITCLVHLRKLLLTLAFYITCVFHLQIFFFFKFYFLLQVFFFFFFWFGSSFLLLLLLLLFSLSFSPYPSSNLLLWNSSLSNSSSMWLNSSMLAVELKFESLNFCHRTWVFNTQDASLQHSFKIVLTNENVPWNHVKLQISPYYIPKN